MNVETDATLISMSKQELLYFAIWLAVLKRRKTSLLDGKKCRYKWSIDAKRKPTANIIQFVTVESIEDYINKAKQLGATIVKK